MVCVAVGWFAVGLSFVAYSILNGLWLLGSGVLLGWAVISLAVAGWSK